MQSIAVLIAVYGRDDPSLFDRALRSCLDQALPEGYELRIYLGIDGPLPDALESVVAEYAERLFYVCRAQENNGLARTLNRLISKRRDEILFFRMDADDFSMPGRFMAQIEYLQANPEIDIVGTAIWECTAAGDRRLIRFAKDSEDARQRIDRRVPVAHPTVCIRRRVFEKVPQYPITRGNEDIAMWFRCVQNGFQFSNLPDPYLEFTISESFWKRRSVDKALTEFTCYVQGIWSLYGPSWRLIFPMARLVLRLGPQWLSRRVYASRLRH